MPTNQQQAAIDAPGNVLVVAGAGTGKTSTLVNRCARLICDEGVPVESLLLVTFTEAAAAEMRHRLRGALDTRLRELQAAAPDSEAARELAGQRDLLDHAQISTLHGFCLDLVSRHFHRLGLDPQVRVLDEQQTAPLMEEVLDAVLGERHERMDDGFQELLTCLGDVPPEPLRDWVRKLHAYAQARPAPADWFTAGRERFAAEEPADWPEWRRIAVTEWAGEWLPILRDEPAENPHAARLVELVEACRAAAPTGELAEPLESLLEWSFDHPEAWKRIKTKVESRLGRLFGEARFLRSQFPSVEHPDPLTNDWLRLRAPMRALLELAADFGAAFTRAKHERGGVDFADLEQLALRLLRDESTGVAAECRERFSHVFVDEYQDINAAQDAILTAVSRHGVAANRFLVGDVKQSIYRFRLAEPAIFARYAKEWARAAGVPPAGSAARVLALTENFRSREAVIDFANAFFEPLLRESLGGVAYDAEARLIFGARAERVELSRTAEPADGQRVELHCLCREETESGGETDGAADLADLETEAREARWMAARLRELHTAGDLIWDRETGRFRPVEWRDMVVLLRSPKSRVEAVAREFHRAGIPFAARRAGFLEALEVMDLINLARLLDNPLQDLPLAAVLHSPLVGMSVDDLAAVRCAGRKMRLWTALMRLVEAGDAGGSLPAGGDTARKASEFAARFRRWRELARHTSLSHTLETVVAETHYEALLAAGPRGAEKIANVRRLFDLAQQFDPYQRQGLHRFLRFITAQEDTGQELEPAPVPATNSVRLMSIHHSKGLEFPVVVVAGLGTQFNRRDLHGELLFDEELGLCPRVLDAAGGRRYPSLPNWLARRRQNRALLGEELRLLYVAFTRARDRLILCGSARQRLDAVAERIGTPRSLSDARIRSANCPLDWVLDWLSSAGNSAVLRRELVGFTDDRLAGGPDEPGRLPEQAPVDEVSAEQLDALRRRLEWTYPHLAATIETAKTSVSELRRRAVEDEDARPRFHIGGVHHADGTRHGAAEIGTANHLFLQLLDLSRAETELDLRNQAGRLVADGSLEPWQGGVLLFERLATFFQGGLGRRIRRQPDRVHREVPFTARFRVDELELARPGSVTPAPVEDDLVVVQGVVDLAVITDAGITILDYKTDHFQPGELDAKVAHYQPQLRLYARALERILGRPVTESWLYFIHTGDAVNVG